MKDIYITKSGTLSRKDNSLLFQNEKEKRTIPIKDINSIYAFGEININSKLMSILSKFEIPIYFYNYYGFFIGQFAPRKQIVSGKLLVEQVMYYKDNFKRLFIAKEIVMASIHNMRKTLMQYNMEEAAEKMNRYKEEVLFKKDIQNLLLLEARSKEFYFKQFNSIIKDSEFKFIKRVRQPPDNFINTLISFGNSLLYTTMLSEIFKTQLNPTISYLHEPFERRYSLNLDLSDIFKPLIVDRVIFSLINRKEITPEHFDKELNYCYLNDKGRKVFLKQYDAKLKTTIKYPGLNRKVSYRYMLRLECYKLIKYFLEDIPYKAFKIYW